VRWGDGKQFKLGRDLAAWLGLTPRQQSSGGKDRLLEISKRGDTYLRMLLIEGAKSVLKVIDKKLTGAAYGYKTYAQGGIKI
jgi:transposase